MAKKAAFGAVQFGDTPLLVGELRGWDTGREPSEIDTTVMGTGNARFQPGAIRSTVTIRLFFEDPDDAGQALLRTEVGSDTPQVISVYPFGITTGKAYLTGNGFVMGENATGEADGAVEIEYSVSGDENGLAWATAP